MRSCAGFAGAAAGELETVRRGWCCERGRVEAEGFEPLYVVRH